MKAAPTTTDAFKLLRVRARLRAGSDDLHIPFHGSGFNGAQDETAHVVQQGASSY